jgi:hypothetical protein
VTAHVALVLALAACAVPAAAVPAAVPHAAARSHAAHHTGTGYAVTGAGCTALLATADPRTPGRLAVLVAGGPIAVLPRDFAPAAPATGVVLACTLRTEDGGDADTATSPPGVAVTALPPVLLTVLAGTPDPPLLCTAVTWRQPDGTPGSWAGSCAAVEPA